MDIMIQPASVAMQLSLWAALQRHYVRTKGGDSALHVRNVLGHSLGELAAVGCTWDDISGIGVKIKERDLRPGLLQAQLLHFAVRWIGQVVDETVALEVRSRGEWTCRIAW